LTPVRLPWSQTLGLVGCAIGMHSLH
jgi:hypothetical protein